MPIRPIRSRWIVADCLQYRKGISRLEALHEPDCTTETRVIAETSSAERNSKGGSVDTARRKKMLRLREDLSNIEEDWLRGESGFSVEEVVDMMEQAINRLRTGLSGEQSL